MSEASNTRVLKMSITIYEQWTYPSLQSCMQLLQISMSENMLPLIGPHSLWVWAAIWRGTIERSTTRRLVVPYTCIQVGKLLRVYCEILTLRLGSTTPFWSRGSIEQLPTVSGFDLLATNIPWYCNSICLRQTVPIVSLMKSKESLVCGLLYEY